MLNNKIAVIKTDPIYPRSVAFSPGESFPEYPFEWHDTNESNNVYSAVRKLLHRLDLDKVNFGKPCWNPLGMLVNEGDTVVIKPNMVKESHLDKPSDFEYIITHGSILRAICDYVIIALRGRGRIIFADSPETDADFSLICERNGLYSILGFYKKHVRDIDIEIMDLRKEHWIKKDGVIISKNKLSGDPSGYTCVSLNGASEFVDHSLNGDYYGATYDRHETQHHHHNGIHEYLLSSTVLDCDVIINVPKLKTHKKAGLTCCLKNLVGLNGNKNWLPHHTEGNPQTGGDQFPSSNLKSVTEHRLGAIIKTVVHRYHLLTYMAWLLKPFGRMVFGSTEKIVRSGNWYGNDTVWRMIVDLNKCLFHFNSRGRMNISKRKVFCIVDAIIAGDNMGPMHADPKPIGLLIGGFDPVSVDRACARIVGFDYRKIPSIKQSYMVREMSFTCNESDKIRIVSNAQKLNGDLESIVPDLEMRFAPHFGWKGHIEID